MNRYLLLIIFTLIVFGCDSKKTLKVDLNNDIVNPKTYVVYKTTNSIIVDGKDDEADWLNTQFSDDFIDIEGFKTPNKKTNVKMLWDHKYLYIFAKLEEDQFRFDHNGDAMATEKLAEGIRNFVIDQNKLEADLRARLS